MEPAKMSTENSSDRVCYVHCHFCNTVLVLQRPLMRVVALMPTDTATCLTVTKMGDPVLTNSLHLSPYFIEDPNFVNVPCSSLFNIVTVRCGHCANLLSVNVGAMLQSFHLQDYNFHQIQKQHPAVCKDNVGSSSRSNVIATFQPEHVQPKTTPIRPPEKRQRVPSAYNRFIKEEIQRIKASNPEISHREAFSTAAKNWAHFPHIHFGLKPETNNKQATKLDHVAGEEIPKKSFGFY